MEEKHNHSSNPTIVKAVASRFGISTPFLGINPNDLKLSSKDTGGKLSTFHYIGVQKVGPGLHAHLNQDEIFYVIEGQYLFVLGQEKKLLQTGDLIFLPRNIPHTWVQMSERGELFYFLQPAGQMEEFFLMMTETAGKSATQNSDDGSLAYGMVGLGPGLDAADHHILSEKLSNGFMVSGGSSRFSETTILGGVSPNDIKVSGTDTSSELSIFEYSGNEKGGPPLHIHPNQDEIFYVLQGEYCFQSADAKYSLNKGDLIFLPRGVPHTWAQRTGKGKLLFFFQPAGKMEAFFRAAGSPSGGGPNLFEQHEMIIVGPPLAIVD